MNDWIDINLSHPPLWRTRQRRVLWSCAAIVLAGLLVFNAWRYLSVQQDIVELEQQGLTQSRKARPSLSALTPEQTQTNQAIHDMLNELSTPWEELLLGVEAAVPNGLWLESLQPQINRSSILIKVMAKDFPSVIAFTEALGNDPRFRSARLVSEIQAEPNVPYPWRAVVELGWKPARHD
jgi:Tfp pilus assembly protein PilN